MGNEALRFPYYRKHQKGQLANCLPNAPPELFGSCMWPAAILKNGNSKSLAKPRKEALETRSLEPGYTVYCPSPLRLQFKSNNLKSFNVGSV